MYFHLEVQGPHAADLSYVLGKHPDRLFELELHRQPVRVFFPLYSAQQSRVTVLFWPDLRTLDRRARQGSSRDTLRPRGFSLNSLFCAAVKTAFNSVVSGHRQAPAEVLNRVHPVRVLLSPICSYLSPERISALFLPLGYQVQIQELPQLKWPASNRVPRVFEVQLSGDQTIGDVLRQLLVLILAIDSERNEFLGHADVDRLRLFGAGWLHQHPEQSFIVSKYLVYRRLIDTYLQNRAPTRDQAGEAPDVSNDDGYEAGGEPPPLRLLADQARHRLVAEAIARLPGTPQKILQVSCGDGRQLVELLAHGAFSDVIGADSSHSALEKARRRLERAGRFSQALRQKSTRMELVASSIGYFDPRLQGMDVVLLSDMLGRMELSRLEFLLLALATQCVPRQLVVTAFRGVQHDDKHVEPDDLDGRLRRLGIAVSRLGGWTYQTTQLESSPGDIGGGLWMLTLTRQGGK